MAYSDPQTVTVNSVPVSLPRTSSGPTSGAFTSSDGTLQLSVSHALGRRHRRSVRLTQNLITADPLIPSQNRPTSMSCYMVVDTPVNGMTNAQIKQVVDALTGYLTASTGARVTQLLGGEN